MTAGSDEGRGRTGGDLTVETLVALGARDVVGLPGQHALGLFDALRRSPLRLLEARVENNAGFMADGLARVTGTVVPLLLSTGPGALTSLPALMEASLSSVPVLVISSQIPSSGLGGARRGHLHELDDQGSAFAQVVKSVTTVRTAAQIPSALHAAWQLALSAPQGPVLVEIPQDVLLAEVGEFLPPPEPLSVVPTVAAPRPELVDVAARLLDGAARPLVIAGGGAERAGAGAELLAVAEALDAPIVSTFSGRNAVPRDHDLHVGSWMEHSEVEELVADADVVLVVGSGLGELTTNMHAVRPSGRVIQIDADLAVFRSSSADVVLHADARLALAALAQKLRSSSSSARRSEAVQLVRAARSRITQRLEARGWEAELALLDAVRRGTPASVDTFWDMTILAYWAWCAWDRRDGRFDSAQGSGGLGFAFPAAIGASFGSGRPVLAVSGDGGAMYSIAELVTALQNRVNVTWLIIDSGGYGVLRAYMEEAFGAATAVDLVTPDFQALATACGVPASTVTPEQLEDALATSLSTLGPSVVIVRADPRLYFP